jgi:hypothetical protein
MAYCGDCDGCGWVEGGKTLKTPCSACGGTGASLASHPLVSHRLTEDEARFGNYSVGRYALITEDMRRLATPVPYKSRQGKLLDLPADVEALVMEELRRTA